MNYIILDTLSVADSSTPIEAEKREGPSRKVGRPKNAWSYNLVDAIPTCPVCGRKFGTGSAATHHLRYHHPQEYKQRKEEAAEH